MNDVAMFEFDLVEVKEINGYTVKVYDDEWYDKIVIEKNGKEVYMERGHFTDADIETMVNNLK